MPTFSRRTSWRREPNQLTQLCREMSGQGQELLDLTESNPSRCGLPVPSWLLEQLGHPDGASYHPDPSGSLAARRSVDGYYRARGAAVQLDRIVLTTSTSEAYGYLFKLLADPGDEVLVPQPSYPLLPLLAELEGIRLVPFSLLREERWRVDVAGIERALTPRTKAIVLVHPNNPTGSFVRPDDAAAIQAMAQARGVPLIVDEVFGDYGAGRRADRLQTFVGCDEAPCFVLSGLSKVALAPQLKLGWIVCQGRKSFVAEAVERLRLLADCYLSVSTAVQLVVPGIVDRLGELQSPLHERLRENELAIDAAISACGEDCPVRRLPRDAGWYALLEVPRTRTDDEWVERLVRDHGLIVHPGYFFDMPGAGTMVVSLLLEPQRFAPAIAQAVRCWSAA